MLGIGYAIREIESDDDGGGEIRDGQRYISLLHDDDDLSKMKFRALKDTVRWVNHKIM